LTDIEKILASGKHFARKFDPEVDGDILDALDRQLNHQKEKKESRSTDGSVTN
jgi:hypothetical protein